MATAAKRQLALSAALWKELNQLARREGKSTVAVLQDLVFREQTQSARTGIQNDPRLLE